MADNSLLISIGVDNSSASKQLNAVKKELKSLDQQMVLVNDSTGDYNKTAKGMTEVLSLQERKLEGVEAQLKLQQDILKKNTTTLNEKKKKLEELENAEEKNAKEIEKARKEVELYNSKVNQSQNDIAKTTAEMDKMNRVIDEQKGALAKVNFDKMSTSLKGVSDATGALASKLTPLSVALGAVFTASMVTAMDFEESIVQVGVTSQATSDELATLKTRALELGEQLPISSKDAADGLNYLA